jgi:hypothetical protein
MPRPDSQGPGTHASGDSPAGYEPPQFVPPQGSAIPAPPAFGQNQYGHTQYGAGLYGQPGEQYGAPYAQPGAPYGQPSSPYAQPNPYGQSAYYGAPAEPKNLSIASMICGIASVLLGWFLVPQVAAIITGHLALKREPSGKGMSITGLVLGYLCLLGYGAFWLFLIIGVTMYTANGYPY